MQQIKIRELISELELLAPLSFQESYDNAGLTIGNPDNIIESCLICVDITEDIIDEAINRKAGLIISHHPLIFSGIKQLTGKNFVERIVIKAIQNNIAIYSAHTNLDVVQGGVNSKICEKLGLTNTKILAPTETSLTKLVVFCPVDYAEKVRNAIFEAGGGHIGNYDCCSYNLEGLGSFRGGKGTAPFVGEKGKIHFEKETRIETILPSFLSNKVIGKVIEAHPYEEVAYDLYPLANKYNKIGLGMVGEFKEAIDEKNFLKQVKETFLTDCIRHTKLEGNKIKKVAVCGGSGSSLLKKAMRSGAQAFITGDFKYHQFFDGEGKILIADIGHYESEQFTKDIFYDILTKKFPKFAIHLTEINSNPINYF